MCALVKKCVDHPFPLQKRTKRGVRHANGRKPTRPAEVLPSSGPGDRRFELRLSEGTGSLGAKIWAVVILAKSLALPNPSLVFGKIRWKSGT